MNSFYNYPKQKGLHTISPSLLWDYDLTDFDWMRYRAEVVKRVIMMGRLADFFAAFDLYGGIEGVKRIAKDEVNDLSDRELDFMCQVFNLEKEKTLCYEKKQSRAQLLHS